MNSDWNEVMEAVEGIQYYLSNCYPELVVYTEREVTGDDSAAMRLLIAKPPRPPLTVATVVLEE